MSAAGRGETRPGKQRAVAATLCRSAAGEALANAVEIQDSGPGFNGDLRTRNGRVLTPRGYGSRLMTTLMDAVEFADNGRCVRLTKYLEPPRL